MSVYVKDEDRLVFEETGDEKKEILGNISSRINKGGEPPTASMEQEKRMRREIANSNERRRMQSINNGFQSLKSLLPHHEGEKLSKAAILQQTAEYIYSLEQEKTRLLSQNCQLKRLVNQHEGGEIMPPKKRKTATEHIVMTVAQAAAESSDEGLGSMSPEPVGVITVAVNPTDTSNDLKRQLEHERSIRLVLEDQVRQLEAQLFQVQQREAQIQQTQLFKLDTAEADVATVAAMELQLVAADSLPPVGHTQTVTCSASPPDSRCASPTPAAVVVIPQEQRLPSVLEAAIKAEPKVAVERLPSPNPAQEDSATLANSRIYSNTSRQNLETIVEAIRHLEGDHMFGEEPHPITTASAAPAVATVVTSPQEVPLALTTRHADSLKADMQAYLDFGAAGAGNVVQQRRPGVIVVKQAS